jgi:hypothetical protein
LNQSIEAKLKILFIFPSYSPEILNMYPLVMTDIAMGNGPLIDGVPFKNGDFPWQTVSHNQMVNVHQCGEIFP